MCRDIPLWVWIIEGGGRRGRKEMEEVEEEVL